MLATTPWLARMYPPAAFGEYAAFLSMCNVFVATACFRYDAALNAADDDKVASLFGAAFLATLATAGFGALAVWSPWAHALLGRVVGEGASVWNVAAAAIVCGVFQASSAMAIRDGRFAWSSLLRLAQPAVFSIAALLSPIGLIYSCLLGFAVATPLALRYLTRLDWAGLARVVPSAWRFREFPIVSLPTSLLDAGSLAMPIWFISSQYSSHDAGNYAQAQRLLAAPLTLFAMALGQVFLKRAGDIVRQGASPRAFQRRVAVWLALGAGVLLLGVMLLGRPVLHLFLGDGWRTDTEFLVLVFLPVAVRSCVSPVTGIFIVKARLRICAIWQALYFCITGAVFYSLAGHVPIEQLLIAYAISETVCYGLYLYIADKVAG
ncbi:lipopolysaccharide biosynthesis protein [Pandoraea terrae]|uniref:lipopolysaccharide biosynthesis protein n=1 Tax=Pandoraea terrae TaxID=1537710 RepID=UPI0012406A7A|nr:oligosaccharide flippase family protein [Pandoraea terrae]